jgi:pimeloyl-ACP methyl ester carboxylesterase
MAKKTLLKALVAIIITILLLVMVLWGHHDIAPEILKVTYSTTLSRFINIENIEVHYRDEGLESDSVPLVLLHGTGASLHTFDALVSVLKKSHRIIRLDLPAFGITGPFSDRDYSMAAYTGFMKKFLAGLSVRQCALGGNSLGGQIALNYTIKYPEQIKKLILIDAAGLMYKEIHPPVAFKIAKIPVLNKIMTYITPKFIIRNSVEDVYYDKSLVTNELVQRYFDLTLRSGNRQAVVDRLTTPKTYASMDELHTISQPTLIIWGENDMLIPVSCAAVFKKYITKSEVLIIENCGHVPMEECPDKVLPAMITFLDKVNG